MVVIARNEVMRHILDSLLRFARNDVFNFYLNLVIFLTLAILFR